MKIKELLSDPSNWTKGANAKRADGFMTVPNSPLATCFCIIGAVRKCYPNIEDWSIVYNKLKINVPNRDVVGWNDAPERTHAEVLELVTRLDI